MSGTKGHSGRRRKATARFRGETWVRMSMADCATINGVTFDAGDGEWYVAGKRYTDFTAAAAEFVRRVNGA